MYVIDLFLTFPVIGIIVKLTPAVIEDCVFQ